MQSPLLLRAIFHLGYQLDKIPVVPPLLLYAVALGSQLVVGTNTDPSELADMVDDQYRGLLTDREREIITGEAEVSDNYRYRVVSRVRTKIDNLNDDVEILSNNRQDLLNELQEVVCEVQNTNK